METIDFFSPKATYLVFPLPGRTAGQIWEWWSLHADTKSTRDIRRRDLQDDLTFNHFLSTWVSKSKTFNFKLSQRLSRSLSTFSEARRQTDTNLGPVTQFYQTATVDMELLTVY